MTLLPTAPMRRQNSRPASPAFSSRSSSGGKAQSLKYSHQAAFFSRRYQSRTLASNHRACSSSLAFARIKRDIARQPAVQLLDALLALVDRLAWAPASSGGLVIDCPAWTRPSRRRSSQSRSPWRRQGSHRDYRCRPQPGCRGGRVSASQAPAGVDRAQRKGGLGGRDLPLKTVEDFQVLQGVALDTGAKRLAGDRVRGRQAAFPSEGGRVLLPGWRSGP